MISTLKLCKIHNCELNISIFRLSAVGRVFYTAHEALSMLYQNETSHLYGNEDLEKHRYA